MSENNQMQDKEILTDMLTAQKHIATNYSLFADECANPQLRTDMMTLLKEEHEIQAQVFEEMQSRGWYQVSAAEQSCIDQAKQKFSQNQ